MNRIRNGPIREELKIRSILDYMEVRQQSFFGMQCKIVWEGKCKIRRNRGKPRETFENVIGKFLEENGTAWKQGQNNRRMNEGSL